MKTTICHFFPLGIGPRLCNTSTAQGFHARTPKEWNSCITKFEDTPCAECAELLPIHLLNNDYSEVDR